MQYSKDIQINTFVKGMDMDIDVNLIDSNTYRYAENVRIVTDSDGSSSILQNSDGIEDVCEIWTKTDGEKIYHVDYIRNYAVIFTKGVDLQDRIYRLDFSLDYENDNFQVLILEGLLRIVGPISSVCRFEAIDNVKIYWADKSESNPIRVVNILPEFAFDNKDYYIGISEGYVNITPSFPLSKLEFIGFGQGSLKHGAYQYAYQVYNNYNSASLVSSMTDMIYVGEWNQDSSANYILGGAEGAQSSKSIRLRLSGDDMSLYSKVRIYRAYYNNYSATPVLVNIGEYSIVDGSVYVEDNGANVIDEVLEEQMQETASYQFSPKFLESKQNYLFAANIKEISNDFTIDYDARAYRYNPSGMSKIYNNNRTESTTFSKKDLVNGVIENIPSDYDCEWANKIDASTGDDKAYGLTDDSYIYDVEYNEDGSIAGMYLGGSGKNISYEFVTTDMILDDSNPEWGQVGLEWNSMSVYNSIRDISGMAVRGKYRPGDGISVDEKSRCKYSSSVVYDFKLEPHRGQLNYSNPFLSSKMKSLVRDEVYRYGIKFKNSRGVSSTVLWIGDIKTPSNSMIPYVSGPYDKRYAMYVSGRDSSGNPIYSTIASACTVLPLGIRFKVNNIPDGVVSYEIVRCNRTGSDRSVICSVVLNNTFIEEDATPYGYNYTQESTQRPRVGANDTIRRNMWYLTSSGRNAPYVLNRESWYSSYAKYVRLLMESNQCPDHVIDRNTYSLVSPEISYNNMGVYDSISPEGGTFNLKGSIGLESRYKPYMLLNPDLGTNVSYNLFRGNVGTQNMAFQADFYDAKASTRSSDWVFNTSLFPGQCSPYYYRHSSTPDKGRDDFYFNYFIEPYVRAGSYDGDDVVSHDYSLIGGITTTSKYYFQYNYAKFMPGDTLKWPASEYSSTLIPQSSSYSNISDIWLSASDFKRGYDSNNGTIPPNRGVLNGATPSDSQLAIYCGNAPCVNASVMYSHVTSKLVDGEIVLGRGAQGLEVSSTIGAQSGNGRPCPTHGPVAFVHINNGFTVTSNNTSNTSRGVAYSYMPGRIDAGFSINGINIYNIIRNIGSQYGGPSYSSRQYSVYRSYGCVESSTVNSIISFGGDTYICLHDYLVTSKVYGSGGGVENYQFGGDRGIISTSSSVQHSAFIPMETSINTYLDRGMTFGRAVGNTSQVNLGNTRFEIISSTPGVYDKADGPTNMQFNAGVYGYLGSQSWAQSKDMYLYNSAYSAYNKVTPFLSKLDFTKSNKSFDCRILQSQPKKNDQLTDQWCIFQSSDCLDVDTRFGQITNLRNFKDNLFFWQENSFGYVAVNERSLTTDNNTSSLLLGLGTGMTRYDYLTTENGIKYPTSGVCVTSNKAMYFYDKNKSEILMYSGSLDSLSKVKGVQSYLNEYKDDFQNRAAFCYDNKYNEVLFTFRYVDNNSVNQVDDEPIFTAEKYVYDITSDAQTINDIITSTIGGNHIGFTISNVVGNAAVLINDDGSSSSIDISVPQNNSTTVGNTITITLIQNLSKLRIDIVINQAVRVIPPVLTVTPQSYNLDYDDTTSKNSTVISTVNGESSLWNASTTDSWISIITYTGNSSENVTFSCTQNDGIGRTGHITVTQIETGDTEAITIIQGDYGGGFSDISPIEPSISVFEIKKYRAVYFQKNLSQAPWYLYETLIDPSQSEIDNVLSDGYFIASDNMHNDSLGDSYSYIAVGISIKAPYTINSSTQLGLTINGSVGDNKDSISMNIKVNGDIWAKHPYQNKSSIFDTIDFKSYNGTDFYCTNNYVICKARQLDSLRRPVGNYINTVEVLKIPYSYGNGDYAEINFGRDILFSGLNQSYNFQDYFYLYYDIDFMNFKAKSPKHGGVDIYFDGIDYANVASGRTSNAYNFKYEHI